MKKFIKYPLIGLGALFALVLVFIILVLFGVFDQENRLDCETYSLEQQSNEKSYPVDEYKEWDIWIEEPDTIQGIANFILHRYLPSHDNGYFKIFNSKGSQNFYYNTRHGFFVLLPKEMGFYQQGEPQLGGHSNQFYNKDTTLVISCGAIFYDVLLDDYSHYADTLRNNHLKYLETMGKVQFLSRKPNEIVAKVFIDGTHSENPPSDYLLSKWVLKKDIGKRDCDMSLNIWYNDSLNSRESEFLNIINKFPNNPFNN